MQFLVINLVILLSRIFSNNLENTYSREIGRSSSSEVGGVFFGIGMTLATWKSFGKVSNSMHLLNNLARSRVSRNRKLYYFADRTIDKNCMTNRRNQFVLRSDLTKKPRPTSPNEYSKRPNLTHLATVLTVLLFNKHKLHCSLR